MNTPYAEQYLLDYSCNQWFVQFYLDDADYDATTLTQHVHWANSNLLTLTPVATVGLTSNETGFYHVNFTGHDDARLAFYMNQFEDAQGISLKPRSYQMFEWDYVSWVEQGAREEFVQFLEGNAPPNPDASS
jgi:hypothetical protein